MARRLLGKICRAPLRRVCEAGCRESLSFRQTIDCPSARSRRSSTSACPPERKSFYRLRHCEGITPPFLIRLREGGEFDLASDQYSPDVSSVLSHHRLPGLATPGFLKLGHILH